MIPSACVRAKHSIREDVKSTKPGAAHGSHQPRRVVSGRRGRHARRAARPADRVAPRAYALFAHCFTCSKDTQAATFISEALTDAGIAVLRFDFTGLGGSEGDFANTTFSSNVADLVAAAAWLRREHHAPAILVGHSLGGAAVLAAAGSIPEAVAVATINAPADPAHVAHLFASSAPRSTRTARPRSSWRAGSFASAASSSTTLPSGSSRPRSPRSTAR